MIVFCIIFAQYNNINIYKKWLINLDKLKKIFRLENLNLNSSEIQKLLSQVTQKVNRIIIIIFIAKQKK